MKKLFIFVFVFAVFSVQAQITIDELDLPQTNVSYMNHTTMQFSFDYQLTGSNYVWDFGSLTPDASEEVIYNDLDSVPMFLATTMNYPPSGPQSNLVMPLGELPIETPIPVTDAFEFYTLNSSGFTNNGFGTMLSGFPFPAKYDSPVVYYELPLNYEDTFASSSNMQISIPNMFFYSSSIERSSEVDGWGTLILNEDTFEVLRMTTQIFQQDSVYIDSIGTGFNIPALASTEYAWLAKENGIPVLKVTDDGFVPTAEFTPYEMVGIDEINPSFEGLQIYVDANNEVVCNMNLFESGTLSLVIYDQNGRLIQSAQVQGLHAGENNLRIPMSESIATGIYVAKVQVNQFVKSQLILF